MCGKKCTPQHVVMAECAACEGSKTGYLGKRVSVGKTRGTGCGPKFHGPTKAPLARRAAGAGAPPSNGASGNPAAVPRFNLGLIRPSHARATGAFVSVAQRSDAGRRVQEQEQLQRRALVAGAAGRGRLVNFL